MLPTQLPRTTSEIKEYRRRLDMFFSARFQYTRPMCITHGFNYGHLKDVLAGRKRLTRQYHNKICQTFHIPEHYLLAGTPDRQTILAALVI